MAQGNKNKHKNKTENKSGKNHNRDKIQIEAQELPGDKLKTVSGESITEEKMLREARIAARGNEWAMQDVTETLVKWDASMSSSLNNFEKHVTALKDEVFMMRKFPDEISKKISSITPDVASGVFTILQQNLTDTFDKNVAICNSRLKELEKSIDIVTTKMQSLHMYDFKKKIASIGLIVLMSAVSAVSSSYYMMKQFPQRVAVHGTGAVSIKESTVSIWDNNGIKVKK